MQLSLIPALYRYSEKSIRRVNFVASARKLQIDLDVAGFKGTATLPHFIQREFNFS